MSSAGTTKEITVSLTPWELERLTLNCAIPNALTYMQHDAMGHLRPKEIEEKDRWVALAKKLTDAGEKK